MSKKLKTLFIILISLLILIPAYSSMFKELKLGERVKIANTIVLGECVKKETKWVGARIETTVTIKSKEYLKGDKGEEFVVTLLGGEMKNPVPITQFVDGQPFFYEGEKVLLFLENHKPLTQPIPEKLKESGLYTTPVIVGMYQGKYSIITDKKTGKEKAVQIDWGKMGKVPQEYSAKKLIETMENAEQDNSIKMKLQASTVNLDEFKKTIKDIIEKQSLEK